MQANLLAQFSKLLGANGAKGMPANNASKVGGQDVNALFSKLMKLVNSNASSDDILKLVNQESKGLNKEDKELLMNVMADFMEGEEHVEVAEENPLMEMAQSKNESKAEAPKENTRNSFFVKSENKDEKLLSILDKKQPALESAKVQQGPLAQVLKDKGIAHAEMPQTLTQVQGQEQVKTPVNLKLAALSGKFSKDASPESPKLEGQRNLQSGDDFLNNLAMMKKPQMNQEKTSTNNVFSLSKFQKEQSVLENGIIKTKKSDFFKTSAKEENSDSEVKVDEKVHSFSKEEAALAMLTKEGIRPIHKMNTESSVNGQTKVLDLSSINPSDTNQVIEKISDYITQSRFNNTDSLDLVVKHDSLGQFNVQVNKTSGSDLIDLQIKTATAEGNQFFARHESDLLKHLGQNGVKVADLKIAMSDAITMSNGSEMRKNTDSGSQFSGNQHQGSHNSSNGSSQDFSRGGEQRRRQMWEEYRERLGA